MNGSPCLQVNVSKSFANFSCAVSFSIDKPRCGVFGHSGSGKSTLMAMIAGLLTPDSGRIALNGATLFDSQAKINLPPEKRRVGVVFQQAHLFPHLNVRKNLFYGRKRVAVAERTIEPEQLISILQLDPLLDRGINRLSGGERQRVALGRTILANPKLILLDEPLSGLDGQLKYQIIPYLQKVFARYAIPMLFISHSLQEMRLMTEEVVVMRDGKNDPPQPTEELARASLGHSGHDFINLLELEEPEDQGKLLSYRWGQVQLFLVNDDAPLPGRFTLSSRDILLFKKHPEATSARNMLHCVVTKLYSTDWLVGVELDCLGNSLIVEIVPQSVEELDIRPGSELIAVFKASAFRRLY
jgi:molybdate transport system ATP-binding protein